MKFLKAMTHPIITLDYARCDANDLLHIAIISHIDIRAIESYKLGYLALLSALSISIERMTDSNLSSSRLAQAPPPFSLLPGEWHEMLVFMNSFSHRSKLAL